MTAKELLNLNMKYQNSRVLVTGGLGFIGSALVRRLVALNASVTVVDNEDPGSGSNRANLSSVLPKVQLFAQDIRDESAIKSLVKGQDYIFHMAAQSGHMDSMNNPIQDLRVNVEGTLNLLEACRHENPQVRFIFASTRQLYGVPQYLPVNEEHPISPVDVNGIHKLATEQLVNLYHRCYQLPTTVFRLTNIYGPGFRVKDARQMFLGHWIRCLIDNKPIEVWGGEQQRDLLYIDDLRDVMLRSALHPDTIGEVFNVAGQSTVSLTELAALLVGVRGEGSYLMKAYPNERKAIELGSIYLTDAKLRTLLDWQPLVGLRDGLSKTVAYYEQFQSEY